MRNLNHLNRYFMGNREDFSTLMEEGTFNKEYVIPANGGMLHLLCSNTLGWDHIFFKVVLDTVLSKYRMPSSIEMERIKDLFFESDEAVIEVHPKKENYVNIDSNVLHLWKPNLIELPLPPKIKEFVELDLIRVDDKTQLLIKRGESGGWIAYRVSVLEYGKKINRKPSWDEMCLAKKMLIGEEEEAIQYHARGLNEGEFSLTLWIPPLDIQFPLPEAFLVGIRNDEDENEIVNKIMFRPHEYAFRK